MHCKMIRLFAVLFFLIPITSYSQRSVADSLTKKLPKVEGEEKVRTYYAIGGAYFYLDFAKARQHFSKGLKLAKAENLRSLEIEGEWSLAGLEDFNGKKFQSLNRLMKLYRSGDFSKKDSCVVFGLIGNCLESLGAMEMALEYSKESLQHEYDRSRTEYYYSIEHLARLYSKTHQFDSANFYYRKALHLIKKGTIPGLITHCLTNIGSNYLEQGDYLTARYFYNRALNNFHLNKKFSGDSTLYAVIYDNLAKIHELKGEYKQALQKQKEAVRMILMTNLAQPDLNLRVEFLLHLAQTELNLGYFQDAKEHLDVIRLKNVKRELQLEYYDALCIYYEKVKNPDGLIMALGKKTEIAQSELRDKSINAILNEFVRFQYDQIILEVETQKEIKQRYQSINRKERILGIGFLAILLIILIVFFVVTRKVQQSKNQAADSERKLHEEKLKYKESEAERLTLELELKNKDLLTFAINITKKFEFTDEMALRLQQLRKKNEIQKSDLTELINYVKSFQAVDNGMMMFQKNVNEINSQFLRRLCEKYPELTQNEKELCLLIKLKLSSKEIATMKNITSESVNVLRSRLRKKMNLEMRDDLYGALENI